MCENYNYYGDVDIVCQSQKEALPLVEKRSVFSECTKSKESPKCDEWGGRIGLLPLSFFQLLKAAFHLIQFLF